MIHLHHSSWGSWVFALSVPPRLRAKAVVRGPSEPEARLPREKRLASDVTVSSHGATPKTLDAKGKYMVNIWLICGSLIWFIYMVHFLWFLYMVNIWLMMVSDKGFHK